MFFDPIYGLKDIDFIRLIQFKIIFYYFYYLLNIIYINFISDQWVPLVSDILIKLHFIKLIIRGWPTCHSLIN